MLRGKTKQAEKSTETGRALRAKFLRSVKQGVRPASNIRTRQAAFVGLALVRQYDASVVTHDLQADREAP